MLLTEIDHVAIAVRDLDAAIDYYAKAFGATVAHREIVERDGVEEALRMVAVPALDAGVTYAVRFRCTQDGASTSLAARIWRASDAEPATWTVTTTDATPALQSIGGGIAVDAWNTVTPGNGGAPGPIHVDDITVAAP